MTPRKVYLPRYYTKIAYEEVLYDDGSVEQIPYHAIREAPFADSENHSHEIGSAQGEHWAQVIVDALNAESKRKSRAADRSTT